MCIRDRANIVEEIKKPIATEMKLFEQKFYESMQSNVPPVSYTHLDVYKRQMVTVVLYNDYLVLLLPEIFLITMKLFL